MSGPELIALLAVLGTLTGIVGIVARVAMRAIDRRHERLMAERTGAAGGREVEQLRARVDVLEDAVARVQELEERVDFAERLLVRHQDQPKLPESR
jgi:hypothetical protein